MNDKPEVVVNLKDVDIVAAVFRSMLSEKWISALVPESEIQRFAFNVVRSLNEAQADRK